MAERNSRSITPPGCNERRKLRRASIRAGRPPGAKRRVRSLSAGIARRSIALRASSIPPRSFERNPSIARSPWPTLSAGRRIQPREPAWLGREPT